MPAAVRAMDARALDRGVPSLALMERAAGQLARTVLEVGGRAYGLRVGLLCGKGNNGGDGLAAARLLLDAGAAPRVCLVAGPDGLGADGRVQLERYLAARGRVARTVGEALDGADVAVDCLLGTGASGAPRPPFDAAVDALNARAGPVVACDVPTGVDAATGAVPGVAVRATVTLTLGAEKVGLRLWPARRHCGDLRLADLGLLEEGDAEEGDAEEGEAKEGDRPVAWVLEPADVRAALPATDPAGDKRGRGVVVVLAGAPGMTGAATLVARGALAGGAGLVTVATDAEAVPLIAPTVPEALTLGLPEDPAAAFDRLAERLEAADALAVGPGLGRAPGTVALVRRVVREVGLPLILDADGLNAFRHEGEALADHRSPLLVATPHAREYARLLAGDMEDLWLRRFADVAERAASWGAVVVAKGPGSLVAAPDGRRWVNPTGSAALATGGTGDVLAGLLAALVAARPDPATVAAGVYVHGLAGELAGARAHPRSVRAGDVAAAIPAALRALEAP